MTDAPERIYLDGDVEAGDGMFPRCFENPKYASEPQVEYVRADLATPMRCAECDCEKGGADCNWIATPTPLDDPRVKALVEALQAWLELAPHCSIEEGVCCCGDNMENHANPMDCGHTPVDLGTYIAMQLEEATRAALLALEENK